FQMWEKKKGEEAARSFGTALEMYEKGVAQVREGSPADFKEVLAKFDEIITKYPKTASGELSLLYKGGILLKQGDYDGAIKAYTTFSERAGKEKLYRYFAWEGLGHAYEGKKDFAKALEAYQKILEIGEGYQLAEVNLSIGYCYERMGNEKEALDSFRAFLSKSQRSAHTDVIMRKVSLLAK
ncbi:MAG: tetratricopeptide repeat protein, partial [Deltaproteobacteria bacterium]